MSIRSLEEELLRFELTGPKAHDVVRSVIKPTRGEKEKEGNEPLSNDDVRNPHLLSSF